MDPQQPAPTPPNPTPQPMEPTPAPQPVAPAPVSPAPLPSAPVSAPQPTAAPVAALPNIPSAWPGAWGVYKYSKQAVKYNLGTLLGLWVVTYGISIVLGLVFKKDSPIQYVGDIVGFIIAFMLVKTLFASVRGQKMSFGGAFATIKLSTLLKLFLNYIVLSFSLMFAMIIFIVPFIILFPRLILAPFLVIDRNLGPLEAMQASWELSKGHSGKVWGVVGASIAMMLLMITIIGIPFALYFLFMYSAAFTVLYEYLHTTQATPAPTTVTPPAPTVAPQPPIA